MQFWPSSSLPFVFNMKPLADLTAIRNEFFLDNLSDDIYALKVFYIIRDIFFNLYLFNEILMHGIQGNSIKFVFTLSMKF